MGKWREAFEATLPSPEFLQFGEQFEFRPPATAEQIAAAEKILEFRLPADLRELLSEFNGIWYTTADGRQHGYGEFAYLDTQHMSVDVPNYLAELAESGEEIPASEDLKKVAFFAQSNGYGILWGLCVEDVEGHRAGAVIRLDHEVMELEASHPGLLEFVRNGWM